jgi:hypothetical protein
LERLARALVDTTWMAREPKAIVVTYAFASLSPGAVRVVLQSVCKMPGLLRGELVS